MSKPNNSSTVGPPTQLPLKLWRFLRRLDHAWLPESGGALIAGPLFARLSPSAQTLTPWLCYILDRQQRAMARWEGAGPVIAEVVERYSNGSPADVMWDFTTLRPRKKSATLVSRSQSVTNGDPPEYTPRFPDTAVIRGTLSVLEVFDRSFSAYLAEHWEFCIKGSPGEATRRLAFLLYLLSYWSPPDSAGRAGFATTSRLRAILSGHDA